ncbi:MAG: adenosylcobinamide-GDP ribazoletransferase [Actinomycetota bacterium]
MNPVAAARVSLSTFTVVPVSSQALDRRTARGAMLLAPLVGVAVGAVAALVVVLFRLAIDVEEPYNLLIAVAGVCVLTAASRGLHLDGLADTADALGSYRGPAAAAEIMARGDIGPFGIAAIVLCLLLQVGGLHGCLEAHRATEGLIVAAMAGTLSATVACVGVPAARPVGLGAAVAGSVRAWQAVLAVALSALVAAVAGSIDEASGLHGSVRAVAALGIGLVVAQLFMRHAVHRFGGISGDVFGAVVEVAMTTTLIAVAVIR